MAADCIFCKIASGAIPSHKFYEDAKALAFLDINPLTRGHALVIPKTHAVRFEDMSAELAQHVMRVAHQVLPILSRAVSAPASTIAINNGKEGGQEVPHVHVHLIPRTAGDGGGPIHALFPRRAAPDKDELPRLAETVRAQLASR